MIHLILASLGFIPWVIYIIVTYYSKNFSQIDHMESAKDFWWYLATIGFVYLIYKIVSMVLHKKKIRFSFWHIAGFSVLHLLIVTITYTAAQITTGSPFFVTWGASSLVLFWHILSLLFYPIFLAFLWRAVGYSILKWIKWWDNILLRIRIGLLIFSSWLLALGFFHVFTFTWLMILCGILTILAVPGWITTYQDIKNKFIEIDQHESDSGSLIGFMNPYLISMEFAFLVVSFYPPYAHRMGRSWCLYELSTYYGQYRIYSWMSLNVYLATYHGKWISLGSDCCERILYQSTWRNTFNDNNY